MMTITVEIPALDRLCGILENQDKTGTAQAIEDEIVAKLEAAVKSGVPRPKFTEVPVTDEHPWKSEAKAEPTADAGTSSAPAGAPSSEGKAEEAAPFVTLDQVQRAAAQLRDAGKLGAVTGMFGEFGIKKLSDLEGAKLALFAERLKKLGAKL